MLLRGACVEDEDDYGPKRRNSPVHACREKRCARTTTSTSTSMQTTEPWELTRLRWGARMHECSQRCQTRHLVPSQAIPLPALPAQLSTSTPRNSAACRSIPARNLFCVPGVHLNQATQELCICSSLSPARPCLLLSLSTTIHTSLLSLLSIESLHHPRSQPIALSRLLAVFSETLAAFRHSLAMTSIPDPTSSPLCHRASASLERPFALCPLAPGPSATERMASSSAVGSQPSSCASLATRYTSRSVRCRPRLSTRLNSARLLLSRMLDRRPVSVCLSLHLLARLHPQPWGMSCLASCPWSGTEANGAPHTLNRAALSE